MKIMLSPVRMDAPLHVTRAGDVLTFNEDQSVDLSKGETCPWIVGTPAKEGGVWHLTLILPHGPDAPKETLFPAPIILDGDGAVPLPPYGTAEVLSAPEGLLTDAYGDAGDPPIDHADA